MDKLLVYYQELSREAKTHHSEHEMQQQQQQQPWQTQPNDLRLMDQQVSRLHAQRPSVE